VLRPGGPALGEAPGQPVVLAQEERVEGDEPDEDGDPVVAGVEVGRALLGPGARLLVERQVDPAVEGGRPEQGAVAQPLVVAGAVAVDLRAWVRSSLRGVAGGSPATCEPSSQAVCSLSCWRGAEPQTGEARTKVRQQGGWAQAPNRESPESTLMGAHLSASESLQPEQESVGSSDVLVMSCTRNWPNCIMSMLKRLLVTSWLELSRKRDASRALGLACVLAPARRVSGRAETAAGLTEGPRLAVLVDGRLLAQEGRGGGADRGVVQVVARAVLGAEEHVEACVAAAVLLGRRVLLRRTAFALAVGEDRADGQRRLEAGV